MSEHPAYVSKVGFPRPFSKDPIVLKAEIVLLENEIDRLNGLLPAAGRLT